MQDQFGQLVPRGGYMRLERTLLAHALLYACYLAEAPLLGKTVAAMAQLLVQLCHQLQAAPQPVHHQLQSQVG